jgi:hypothetical protein
MGDYRLQSYAFFFRNNTLQGTNQQNFLRRSSRFAQEKPFIGAENEFFPPLTGFFRQRIWRCQAYFVPLQLL